MAERSQEVPRQQHDVAAPLAARRHAHDLEGQHLQTDLQTGDRLVMAVDVSTTPNFQAGMPRLLFKLSGPFPFAGNLNQWKNVSRDGQRFVFAINVPASVTAR